MSMAGELVETNVGNARTYAGVGRTDGEGIERTWSHLNPLAWATKEMREGARHDAIEDKIDHLNFEKNIHQGAREIVVSLLVIDDQTQRRRCHVNLYWRSMSVTARSLLSGRLTGR
jgi:hypothetical protein